VLLLCVQISALHYRHLQDQSNDTQLRKGAVTDPARRVVSAIAQVLFFFFLVVLLQSLVEVCSCCALTRTNPCF
jgi:hypothetical protein